MTRILRRIVVGTLMLLLTAIAAQPAAAGPPEPAAPANKAQVEYYERLQLDNDTPSGWERNKAYIEHLEQERIAHRPDTRPAPVGPVEEPVGANSAQSAAGWQLALTAFAGALIGGLAVTGARRRREHVATPEPDLDNRLRV